MSALFRLVIGTTNVAKGRELADLLSPHGFEVLTLREFPAAGDVVEDGETFAANARKKAIEYALELNEWVLADDSGLEVDALGGRPGIFSARYSGPDATDDANNQHLLAELEGVPAERRLANYFCHVAVADPHGVIRAESCDVCTGRIAKAPAGTNGFGYDPLFEVVEYHRTFGELGTCVKAAISHRARAMRTIAPKLINLARDGSWSK